MVQRLSLVLLLSLLGLTGCGKKEPAAPAAATAASPSKTTTPQIWRVGNGAEPQDLDPQTITGVPEHKLMMALFEGLASEDPKDLHPVPGIAEKWDISPDGLTYTFHVRANAKWSDGSPILASELVESYQRIITPAF
eukprot:gene13545-16562_t